MKITIDTQDLADRAKERLAKYKERGEILLGDLNDRLGSEEEVVLEEQFTLQMVGYAEDNVNRTYDFEQTGTANQIGYEIAKALKEHPGVIWTPRIRR